MTALNKNIPVLRFKGFDQPWKLKKLDDVTEKVNSGKTPLGGQSVYVNSGVLFIRSQNVLDSQLSFDNSTYITEEVNSSMMNSVVKANDILLNITGASLGRSCVVPKDFKSGNVNQHVCIVRLNNENDPYFLQPIFASEKGQNLFTSLQTGSGREGLNFQSIKKISLSFPSLPEQQKIASFLSAIDEKIRQLTRRKELLEQYKKGVMQQLFSGKLRFKDEKGKAYPKWEEKRLGDVAKLQGGYAFKSHMFQQDGIPVIRISNISNDHNHMDLSNVVYYDKIPNPANFTIKKGDLILAMSGATTGKSSIYNLPFNAYLNQRVGLFKSKTDKLSYEFLVQFVFSEDFHKQLETVLVAGAQPNVSSSDIESFSFPFPIRAEQQKIASFLSSIDTKIESVTTQIERTKGYKKGLLQKMFV